MNNGIYSLNKASIIKRLAAWLLDAIVVVIIAVGFMLLTSVVIGYDKQITKLNEYYEKYDLYVEDEDGNRDFCTLNPNNELDPCNVGWRKFGEDKDAVAQYEKVNTYSVIILSSGVVFGVMITYCILPLIFKNGKTLGKKIFSIALITDDEIRVTPRCIFIRSLFGNFLVITMIPILLIFTGMTSGGGLLYTLGALVIIIGNIGSVIFTKNHQNIPDLIAKTIPVDATCQIIVDTKEELSELKYQNNKN